MARTKNTPVEIEPDAPDLPDELDEVAAGALVDGPVEQCRIAGGTFGELDALVADECVLEGLVLSGARPGAVVLRDVVLRDCDLSGTVLPERAQLSRVRFEGCRASGMELPMASLRDVDIVGGRMDLASFRHAELERVRFGGVRASELDLRDARLSMSALIDCDLQRADFTGANLDRVALFGSVLEDLRGVEHLRGASVSPEQLIAMAPALAAAYGICVTERAGPMR